MEGVTWLTHRYVMHGFLWYLHEDHHKKGNGFFEKNDWFFVIFAIPSWLCIMLGSMNQVYWVHHKHINKEEGESFGMLLVAKKYWDKIRRDETIQNQPQ